MPKSKPRSDEVKCCWDCSHFSWGVCDYKGFISDPSDPYFTCNRKEPKDAETKTTR